MNSTIRLQQINRKLDPVVKFAAMGIDDDDDNKPRYGQAAAAGVGVGAGAVGAYKVNQAILARQGAMNALVPGAKTSYGAAAQNLGKSTYISAKDALASGVSSGKSALGNFLKKLRPVATGVAEAAMSARHARLIRLNSLLARRIEFQDYNPPQSPWANFRDAHKRIVADKVKTMEESVANFRQAKAAQRVAKRGVAEANLGISPEHPAIQRKLHRESYVRAGTGIGALAGAAIGTGAGLALGRKGRGRSIAAPIAGGYLGTVGGALGGLEIGGRIRRKEPLPPGRYGIHDYIP